MLIMPISLRSRKNSVPKAFVAGKAKASLLADAPIGDEPAGVIPPIIIRSTWL
jgi:hypothetical protein